MMCWRRSREMSHKQYLLFCSCVLPRGVLKAFMSPDVTRYLGKLRRSAAFGACRLVLPHFIRCHVLVIPDCTVCRSIYAT